jgi:hypothetical protein
MMPIFFIYLQYSNCEEALVPFENIKNFLKQESGTHALICGDLSKAVYLCPVIPMLAEDVSCRQKRKKGERRRRSDGKSR